jgi:hypothetical protein
MSGELESWLGLRLSYLLVHLQVFQIIISLVVDALVHSLISFVKRCFLSFEVRLIVTVLSWINHLVYSFCALHSPIDCLIHVWRLSIRPLFLLSGRNYYLSSLLGVINLAGVEVHRSIDTLLVLFEHCHESSSSIPRFWLLINISLFLLGARYTIVLPLYDLVKANFLIFSCIYESLLSCHSLTLTPASPFWPNTLVGD